MTSDQVPRRVLIVDDEAQVCERLKEALCTDGWDVDTCSSGGQVEERLGTFLPSVVVLDLRMPQKDGLDVLRDIERDHPWTRVVVVTGHGDDEGRILGQDRLPCWVEDSVPDLNGAIVYAHACRGFAWLTRQSMQLRTRAIWGYAVDLLQPPSAEGSFWELYREIHTVVPARLLGGTDAEAIRREFYELCTQVFDELNSHGAGLLELVAITQSRDRLELHDTGESWTTG